VSLSAQHSLVSAILLRIHTVTSYTSAITEAHYSVLALTNDEY